MAKDEGEYQVAPIFYGLLAGPFIGLFGGLAIDLVILFATGHFTNPPFNFVLAMAGVVVGPIVGGLREKKRVAMVQNRRRAQETAHANSTAIENSRIQSERERTIVQLVEAAATAFNSLPGLLEHAQDSLSAANHHFEAGAFSPFWECVEESYESLGDYSDHVAQITAARKEYVQRTESYLDQYGERSGFIAPSFPVYLDAARAIEAAVVVEKALRETVYEAQRQPTFALVWEQRRNTAVTIAGFQSLERVVRGMSSMLANGVNTLREAIESNAHAVTDSIAIQSGDVLAVRQSVSTLNEGVATATRHLYEIERLQRHAKR